MHAEPAAVCKTTSAPRGRYTPSVSPANDDETVTAVVRRRVVLFESERSSRASDTQVKQSPMNPARFTMTEISNTGKDLASSLIIGPPVVWLDTCSIT